MTAPRPTEPSDAAWKRAGVALRGIAEWLAEQDAERLEVAA